MTETGVGRETSRTGRRVYEAYGHRIWTNRPVPELGVDERGRADELENGSKQTSSSLGSVRIEFERAPGLLEEVREEDEVEAHVGDVGDDRVQLVFPGVAELWANRSGLRVQYAAERLLPVARSLAVGAGLGSVWHLRGHLVLHGSAVAFDGRSVGFLAPSGGGKSTLAALLLEEGGRLVTDDLLVIPEGTFGEEGVASVEIPPGVPVLRVLSDTEVSEGGVEPVRRYVIDEDATGEQTTGGTDGLRPELPWAEKQFLRANTERRAGWTRLQALCLLREAPEIGLERLTGAERVLSIVAGSYVAEMLGTKRRGSRHFRQCAELVERIPVYALNRPMDGDRTDEAVTAAKRCYDH